MQAVAFGRCAYVAEPTGRHQSPTECVEPRCAAGAVQRVCLADRRNPRQGESPVPCRAKVKSSIGKNSYVEAAQYPKIDRAGTGSWTVQDRRSPDAGQLIKIR